MLRNYISPLWCFKLGLGCAFDLRVYLSCLLITCGLKNKTSFEPSFCLFAQLCCTAAPWWPLMTLQYTHPPRPLFHTFMKQIDWKDSAHWREVEIPLVSLDRNRINVNKSAGEVKFLSQRVEHTPLLQLMGFLFQSLFLHNLNLLTSASVNSFWFFQYTPTALFTFHLHKHCLGCNGFSVSCLPLKPKSGSPRCSWACFWLRLLKS